MLKQHYFLCQQVKKRANMFIRVQRPKRNKSGVIVGGSASVIQSVYDKDATSGHSRQTVVERLGKVIEMSADNKSGMFLSPTRGPVLYDVVQNVFSPVDPNDPRLARATGIPAEREHVTFGDVYLLIRLLERNGLLRVLSGVFPEQKEYERLLAHVVHGFLRDNSSKKCSTLAEQSVLGFLINSIAVSSLRSDARFYELMGQDETKVAFFQAFIRAMRCRDTSFGKGCFIDSTPLANSIHHGNPYKRLRCQAGQGCTEQIRLVLVVDEASGLPIWYELFPGNIMDIHTVATITRRVRDTLGVETVSHILDAGYVSKDAIQQLAGGKEKTLIARMPNRRGYPYKALYHRIKGSVNQAKYNCFRKGCVYFGKRCAINLFDTALQAYVMIDQGRALRDYEKYATEHEAEYETHSDSEKIWDSVRFGYFVLLSNIETRPQEMLNQYLDRIQIEEVFKSSKSFEGLLPLSKWTALTVKGKILADMIDTIVRTMLRKKLPKFEGDLMDLFYDASSIDCSRGPDSTLVIETPNKQARAAYKIFREDVPGVLNLSEWKQRIYRQWM